MKCELYKLHNGIRIGYNLFFIVFGHRNYTTCISQDKIAY